MSHLFCLSIGSAIIDSNLQASEVRMSYRSSSISSSSPSISFSASSTSADVGAFAPSCFSTFADVGAFGPSCFSTATIKSSISEHTELKESSDSCLFKLYDGLAGSLVLPSSLAISFELSNAVLATSSLA
uniref:Uncharacterized protein n=1 Tax=Arundo donax TaxID=35708 RepID=A0A0A9DH82_ARUDO